MPLQMTFAAHRNSTERSKELREPGGPAAARDDRKPERPEADIPCPSITVFASDGRKSAGALTMQVCYPIVENSRPFFHRPTRHRGVDPARIESELKGLCSQRRCNFSPRLIGGEQWHLMRPPSSLLR
jgi:hypothetical protein